MTQSGNMSSLLYRLSRQVGLGFSHIINTGNESGVEFAEYLEYLLDDPATRTVIGYVEGLRDGPRFLRVARAFRERGKLLALFKSGRTEKGAEAARSHTAALAGDARAFEAACRAAGVALAEDVQHLVDLTYLHRFARERRGGQACRRLQEAASVHGISSGHLCRACCHSFPARRKGAPGAALSSATAGPAPPRSAPAGSA